MKYIEETKLKTYLKLKKEMALFIGLGEYFENRTFDWITIRYESDEVIEAKLIQSFNEGNEQFVNVAAFSTVNDLEQEVGDANDTSVKGNFETCMHWIKNQFEADTNKFVPIQDLNDIYSKLVAEGKLGV